jgi:hypothetical protein
MFPNHLIIEINSWEKMLVWRVLIIKGTSAQKWKKNKKKKNKNKMYLWRRVLVSWSTSDEGSYHQKYSWGIFIYEGTCEEGYQKSN